MKRALRLVPQHPDPALLRALEVLEATQDPGGSWKGDYGGPLFLLPVYVSGLYAMGESIAPDVAEGLIRYLRHHQRADGGWGLDIEGTSHVFTSILNYVSLRLLGVRAEDEALQRARSWFLPRGGPLGSGSWGKFTLATLGLYEYAGLHPLVPELWILPRQVPFHPSRMWCHCRMVYLPMSYLYGVQFRAPQTPLLEAIRDELYDEPYAQIHWRAARDEVSWTDAFTPRGPVLKAANLVLGAYENRVVPGLRKRALNEILTQIQGEDEATNYLCIGPINKVLNMLVWHVAKPNGLEVKRHLAKLPDYLYRAADGTKMQGYNSSELWDTAFAVQAVAATGEIAESKEMLERAATFLEANQVLEDSPNPERFYRHPSRGGFPFSTRDHGWPISDCTGEGLLASLKLEEMGLSRIPRDRLFAAVDLLLSLQNDDGGWATYELTRAPEWVEQLNPSDVFATIMTDVSYVECTSSCIKALAAWEARVGVTHGSRVRRAIERGAEFIRKAQRPDGSWEGSWGVCFTYGAWFASQGLLAAGAAPGDLAIERGARFLLGKQRDDGSWSEVVESCRKREWVEGERGHVVNSSWALLTLMGAGLRSSGAVERGMAWLRGQQQADGRWPPEPLAGVFNKTCGIHYDAYLRVFPVWAMGVHRTSK